MKKKYPPRFIMVNMAIGNAPPSWRILADTDAIFDNINSGDIAQSMVNLSNNINGMGKAMKALDRQLDTIIQNVYYGNNYGCNY